MVVNFKGTHFPQEIILTGVRRYVAYPLSMRHMEELMRELGGPRGSRLRQSLGREVQSSVGRNVPSPQSSSGGRPAHGRDLHRLTLMVRKDVRASSQIFAMA